MIGQPIGKNYSKAVNVLFFIFPIVIISLQVVGDVVLLILAMMGIFVSISQKISPFIIKEIKVFSYLTIGYFIAVCSSVLFSGQVAELAHYIPRDFYFLFAPFIALALYKAEININYLIIGAKVSLLVIGGIVIYHGGGRDTGVINPGVFGNLAVSLFFIVVVFSQYESIKHKAFSLLTLFFGLVAIISSGTRGSWVSFLLLLATYLYFYYKQKAKSSSKPKLIIVLIMVSIISIGGFNQSVKDRTNLAYTQISNWMSGDKTPSSVGSRLGMYKKAIDNIKDVPFFGHGYRTSNITLFKDDLSSTGKISVGFNHLHNAYLTNYYNGGIVLLGGLLLILFIPLRKFIKENIRDRENPVFIAGALLILGYASFGMVNILLGDTYMNGFYVFFLAIFLLLTNKSIKLLKT